MCAVCAVRKGKKSKTKRGFFYGGHIIESFLQKSSIMVGNQPNDDYVV